VENPDQKFLDNDLSPTILFIYFINRPKKNYWSFIHI